MARDKKAPRSEGPTKRLLDISAQRRGVAYPELRVSKPAAGVLPRGLAQDSNKLLANDAAIRRVLRWAQADGQMAMDQNILAVPGFGGGAMDEAFWMGTTFLGYTLLGNLSLRAEYRRISEVLATAATDKWIEIKSVSRDKAQDQKIKDIATYIEDIGARPAFKELSEKDGFFGRMHLYLDTGDTDDVKELKTSIGNGRDKISMEKVRKDKRLKEVRTVEPIWCYPAEYDAIDPLKKDWYNPQSWFCLGKQINTTRLLRFVAREVPDILKPTFNFGGLSLTQMSMAYVNNWLTTQQAITDLIKSFSYTVLKMDLASSMQPGFEDAVQRRINLMTNWRSNKGTIALDIKEEFENISTPLGSLDALQAQARDQMCFPTGTPVVVLFGIQPAGLNASSEGELQVWDKWVAAYQRTFFGPGLQTVMDMAQLSLYGEVDPDITYDFVPRRELSEKDEADIRKIDAEIDQTYVDMGAIGNDEVRSRLASDVDSPYAGLPIERDDLGEGLMSEGEEDVEDDPQHDGTEGGERNVQAREDRQTRRPEDNGGRRDEMVRRDETTRRSDRVN